MPGRIVPKRTVSRLPCPRTKRTRPPSLAESISEDEFESVKITPRVHKKKRQVKRSRIGSLKNVKEAPSEKCDECEENFKEGSILNDNYRQVEREMDRLFNFQPRKTTITIPGTHRSFGCGKSIVDFLSLRRTRGSSPLTSQNTAQPVVDLVSNLQLYRTASPFDRRVTAMVWHPTRHNILAVGSKGGDIIIWDTDQVKNEVFLQGSGANGSIQAIKFWPEDTNLVLTSSINGTVMLHNTLKGTAQVLCDTFNSHDFWYCSVDVNLLRRMVVTGDNVGTVKLITPDGNEIMSSRLHKNKVTHVEFHPREDWLLCTASTDQTVKMWDVRKMKERKDCLETLKHDKPVNSAYFSPSDGCRLLTTDQGNEIRVYRAPFWHLETTIIQPHRFFQHITPIKANWHPFQDLIVVGRYPDPKFPGYSLDEIRSTEIFSAETGKRVVELNDPAAAGIKSLHCFNNLGDRLAVGMGFNILLWTRKEHAAEKQEEILQKFREQPGSGERDRGQPSRSRPRPRKKKGQNDGSDDDVGTLKKKIKTKSKTKEKKEKK